MDTNNQNKKVGPIIGALIIVILIVIAALYTWERRLNSAATPADQAAIETTDQTASASNAVQLSTSDDVDSLTKDLNATEQADAAAEAKY
ncbi:MAG: hypothetical protein RIT04_160 [Candidatus Parcubacteria bacterium]|jgi:FlaG/FlaF family flagellin (archaellin)